MTGALPRLAAARPPRHVLVPLRIGPEARHRPAGWQVHSLAGATMGTTWSVRVAAPAAHPLGPVRGAIEAVLDPVVAEMSPWVETSAISRFNAAPAGTWHGLPPMFWGVLSRALALAEATGGAYDPTLGALVELWGFGPAPRGRGVPAPERIAEARARSGWQRLQLRPATRELRQPGGLRLDLSSIAKGFAVDEVGRQLARLGLCHHLVEIGGEVRGAGVKPDGSPWWVAVETPPGPSPSPEWLVALHGLAAATSGDYRRAFTAGGQSYAHTLDPVTGRPAAGDLASVTVLRPSCLEADALATALLVMGRARGLAFADRHGAAALFLERSPTGLSGAMSSALAAMLG